jgi:hypothetical protein
MTTVRVAAFEHVQRSQQTHDALTCDHLREGFLFQGRRLDALRI